VGPDATSTIVELDEALQRLVGLDSRKSELLQLLYFGGLTYDETSRTETSQGLAASGTDAESGEVKKRHGPRRSLAADRRAVLCGPRP